MKKNETDHNGSLRIILPLAGTNQPLVDTLQHGLLYATEIKKMGGRARCLRAADAVIVVLSGVSREQIEPCIDCLGHSPSMNSATMKVIVEERDTPEIDLESDGVIPGEYTRMVLTKKFLLGLPESAIVVGNFIFDGKPNFAARLEPGMDRSRIWRRVIDSDAAQRQCSVYWNKQDVLDIHGLDLDVVNDDDNDEWPLPMFRF